MDFPSRFLMSLHSSTQKVSLKGVKLESPSMWAFTITGHREPMLILPQPHLKHLELIFSVNSFVEFGNILSVFQLFKRYAFDSSKTSKIIRVGHS